MEHLAIKERKKGKLRQGSLDSNSELSLREVLQQVYCYRLRCKTGNDPNKKDLVGHENVGARAKQQSPPPLPQKLLPSTSALLPLHESSLAKQGIYHSEK